MAKQPEQIAGYHDKIVAWRAQGLNLRQIAANLEQFGISTNHNAVYRYCRRTGIPTDRIEPIPKATVPPASSRPSPSPPAPHGWETSASPVSSFTISPAMPSVTFTVASEPAQPPPSGDVVAISRVLAEMTPFARRIEAARSAGDAAELQSALTDSLAWMEKISPTVPEFVRQRIHDAILETTALLTSMHPRVQSPVMAAPAPAAPASRSQRGPVDAKGLWTPDLPLLMFNGGKDAWTLRDACEGTFIMGATGSGKTSGSGAAIAQAFLSSDFGGMVLTVKPDERQLWERYARRAGRLQQLCIVEPGGKHRLNFLDYEARRPGGGAGLIENLVSLFYSALETQARGQGGENARSFWVNAGRQLLRNVFRVLIHGQSRLAIRDISQLLSEAPKASERPNDRTKAESGPHFQDWIRTATLRTKGTEHEPVVTEARRYWLEEFPSLAEETRSCLVTGLTSMADIFVEPAISQLLCSETTLTPDAASRSADQWGSIRQTTGSSTHPTAAAIVGGLWGLAFLRAMIAHGSHKQQRYREGTAWHSMCSGVPRFPWLVRPVQFVISGGAVGVLLFLGLYYFAALAFLALAFSTASDAAAKRAFWSRVLDAVDAQIEAENLSKAVQHRLSPAAAMGLEAPLPASVSGAYQRKVAEAFGLPDSDGDASLTEVKPNTIVSPTQ